MKILSDSPLQKQRLNLFLKQYPQIELTKEIGSGNFGHAYLTNENMVLKLTFDDRELMTATSLENKKLKNIANIFKCWSFDFECSQTNYGTLHCILEEYVPQTNLYEMNKFIKKFRHVWFSIYTEEYNIHRMDNGNLDNYMKNQVQYSHEILFVKNKLLEIGRIEGYHDFFSNVFEQLLCAYSELYTHSPSSRIDVNEGNFGFTSNGVLKVFDIVT